MDLMELEAPPFYWNSNIEKLNYLFLWFIHDSKLQEKEASSRDLLQGKDRKKQRRKHEDVELLELEESPYRWNLCIEEMKQLFARLIYDPNAHENKVLTCDLPPQSNEKKVKELENKLNYVPDRTMISI